MAVAHFEKELWRDAHAHIQVECVRFRLERPRGGTAYLRPQRRRLNLHEPAVVQKASQLANDLPRQIIGSKNLTNRPVSTHSRARPWAKGGRVNLAACHKGLDRVRVHQQVDVAGA